MIGIGSDVGHRLIHDFLIPGFVSAFHGYDSLF